MDPITGKVANSIGHRCSSILRPYRKILYEKEFCIVFLPELREEKFTIVAGTFLGDLIRNVPQICFGAKEQLPSSEWMADEMAPILHRGSLVVVHYTKSRFAIEISELAGGTNNYKRTFDQAGCQSP
ncbi:hypothetical protein DFH06DRAFT_1131693 [Mycena polygramma]|nr:hypothetical protein DFH06DRAFT_1131693 [Mycena polygramma]